MALTAAQLVARRDKIGGSDAAAICGKDPYRTAYEVALRIRGEIEPDTALEDADQILFGNEMEGVLARIYERKHKVDLYQPETLIHAKYPFIAVNIDRMVKAVPHLGLEMKNTGLHARDTWGKPGSDEAPERVIIQCQHAMMVEEAITMFHVLRCYGGNVFQEYVVPRNQGLIDALEQIEVGFHDDVLAGRLPEPDWLHQSTSDTIRRAFTKIQGTIENRPDLTEWTTVYEQAAASLKEAERLEESLKNRIAHMMGNAEIALLPDGRKWRRSLVQRAAYSVPATSYVSTKLMKPRAKKEEE